MAYRLNALRTSSAYRITSDELAYLLAGMLPIDILPNEHQCLCDIGESNAFGWQVARRMVVGYTTSQPSRFCHNGLPYCPRSVSMAETEQN